MSRPSSEPKQLAKAGSATTVGCVRATNEDHHLVDTANGWFAIADGIGGLPYGERASECAIRQLVREIARPGSEERNVTDTVRSCHDAVRKLGKVISPTMGIGTTLTAVHLVSPDSARLAHVGDSVAYRHSISTNSLRQLTTDHTSAVPRVKTIGGGGADFQPPPSLDRYLGQAEPPECDSQVVRFRPGDRLILCSDGITKVIDEAEITAVSVAQPNPTALAEALVHIADLRGGFDNSTVIVMDISLQ